MAKKKSKSTGVNKAELIRQTARSMGKTVRPKEIIAALKTKGVTVTSPQVSKTLKAAGFHRKGRGKKVAVVATNSAAHSNTSTKAERIRQVAKFLGKPVRPRDVIAALRNEGIKVSSAQVSKTLRDAGYRRKRRGRRVAAAAAGTHVVRSGLSLNALLAAKALLQTTGSVKGAEEAIRAIKKLG